LLASKAAIAAALLVTTACGSAGSDGGSSGGDAQAAGGDALDCRRVQLIVPYPAGGSSDLAARALAPGAEESLGLQVQVINRPGSNGTIAASELAESSPTGCEVLFIANGAYTSQPFIKDLPYEIDDFAGVRGIVDEPILLAVNADSAWDSMEDIVADKGHRFTYANSGTAGFPQLAQEAFFQDAGLEASSVPFDGGAPAVTALLGGQVDTVAAHPAELLPFAEAGDLQIVGIFAAERSELLPDIPTTEEAGVDVQMSVWKSLLVPAGTPKGAITALSDAFADAMKTEEFESFLEKFKTVPIDRSGEKVIQTLQEEAQVTQKIIEQLGLGK